MTTTTRSSAAAPDLDPHDRLPVQKHQLVTTPSLKVASMLAALTLDMAGIAVFDGPGGTGKTSAAAWIAREHPEWQWAYLQVPHTVRFDEVPGHVYEALTGYPAHGKVRDIQRENVRLMRHNRVAVIADEVQHAGTKGVQALRYLGDLTAMAPSGGAPIFLVGHGSLGAVSTAPEMLDRLVGTAEFTRLGGGALLEFVGTLHPRLAVTDDAIIGELDDQCAGNGSLRSWHTIAGLLTRVSPHEKPDRPVTMPEVKRIAVFRKHLADARRNDL
jgi:hypothetical protein